jgi:hypothetical protein
MGRWTVTEHICRACLSVILADGSLFKCSNCRAECRGGPETICGCGLRPLGGTVRAGRFACVANPQPSKEAPRLTGIAFVEEAPAAA